MKKTEQKGNTQSRAISEMVFRKAEARNREREVMLRELKEVAKDKKITIKGTFSNLSIT